MTDSLASFAAVCAGLLLLGFAHAPAPTHAQDPPADVVTVGVVIDGGVPAFESTADAIKDELTALTRSEFEVRFPDRWTLHGAEDGAGVPAVLDRLFGSTASGNGAPASASPVDLVIAVGPQASHLAATREALPVPVVAAHVVDAEAQGVPQVDGTSGRPNLSYVTTPGLLRRNVSFLRTLRPFSSPVVLVPASLLDADDALGPRIRRVLDRRGTSGNRWRLVAVRDAAAPTLDALPPETDAAYLVSPLPLSAAETDRLLAGLNARRIATVSHRGRTLVERGALATRYGGTSDPRARRVALNAASILRGDSAAELPVTLDVRSEPLVNVATARQIGVDLSADVLLEATPVGDDATGSVDSLTYAESVRQGVQANRSLEAERASVDAERERVQIQRADLLPQVLLSGQAQTVNEEQALASFGAQPQRSVSGSVSFSQTIFSAREYAQVSIAKDRRDASEAGLDASNRDIALRVAGAYVDVLRARAVARVQRENLSLARENLELADARRESGQVGRREVLRFETQIAQTRQALLEAEAQVRVARTRLKRVLARPLEDDVAVTGLSTQDTTLTLTEDVFARHGRTRASLERLIQVLTDEGLARAPELDALNAQIDAAERGLGAARQSYWAPDLALEGGINSRVLEDGAGTGGLSIPNAPFDVPEPPDTNWSIGLSLQFPLFTGFRRDGQVDRSTAQVQQLTYQRDDVRSRLEEAVRSQTELAAAAYLSLREAEAAAGAGEETLTLVQESYASGIADVLDLIDAQNAVLATRLAETNARYAFLLRLIQTERTIARTGPLQTPAERAAFRLRLRQALDASD